MGKPTAGADQPNTPGRNGRRAEGKSQCRAHALRVQKQPRAANDDTQIPKHTLPRGERRAPVWRASLCPHVSLSLSPRFSVSRVAFVLLLLLLPRVPRTASQHAHTHTKTDTTTSLTLSKKEDARGTFSLSAPRFVRSHSLATTWLTKKRCT